MSVQEHQEQQEPGPSDPLPGRDGPAQPRLIVRSARELAEAEGWDAVTARRLAERTGYAQSDLYHHFTDRDAIVAAVAVEGFAELAAAMRAARTSADGPVTGWAAVVTTYLDFAYASPARYDAMFVLTSDLPFAEPGAPPPLHAAFTELRAILGPLAAGRDLDAFTEVGWCTLHGMVMLTRGGRLRPELQERREAMVVDHLLGPDTTGKVA